MVCDAKFCSDSAQRYMSLKYFLKYSGLCRGFWNFIDVTAVIVSFSSVLITPHPILRSPVSEITSQRYLWCKQLCCTY